MKIKREYIECLRFILDQKDFIDADLIWDMHRQAERLPIRQTLLVERDSLEFWANDLALHGVGDIETAKQLDKLLCIGRVE